ncbi:MAG: hypothetical protein M3X11_09210 [Acidobacteriota bacterium]|nr:hypothetical protein [Acidobacteriota bacterium]
MTKQESQAERNSVDSQTDSLTLSQMEEDGHSLLIVDLLRLPQRFSYKRYRLDVIGFLLAWLWVVLLLLLGWWVSRIGA